MRKMTKREVEEKLKEAKKTQKTSIDFASLPDYFMGGTLKLKNASEWEFEEMSVISEVFETKNIDVVGHGCETCGFGSTIELRDIEVIEDEG